MTCQNVSGTTGLITLQNWPTLKFPPNYPEQSNFSLLLTTTPFFSPPSFLFPKLRSPWTSSRLSAACTTFSLSYRYIYIYTYIHRILHICSIFFANHCKPSRRASMCSLGLLTNIRFWFLQKWYSRRGRVLHNRPQKMYNIVTSAKQLTLHFCAL